MNDINWTQLTSIGQLDELDAQSHKHPVFFFKHSTRCSISSASLSRLERKWDQKSVGSIKPVYLDLISYRDVSDALANKYGIEHQSPQVLLVKEGKCIYDNSHFGISFDELLEHI